MLKLQLFLWNNTATLTFSFGKFFFKRSQIVVALKFTVQLLKLYDELSDILLLFWSSGSEKKEGVWYNMLPNRARLFFIISNIRNIMLVNLVGTVIGIQTSFPGMSGDWNDFGLWNLILFKLFNKSFSSRLVNYVFV